MKTSSCLLLFPILFLVSGCMPVSIYPLYSPDVVVFNNTLLGEWTDDDGDEIWLFEKIKDAEEYELTYTTYFTGWSSNKVDTTSAVFQVFMVNLDGQLYLDIFPKDPQIENLMEWMLMIRAHAFVKLDFTKQGELALSSLGKKFDNAVENGQIDLDYQLLRDDEQILITASTIELQTFVQNNSLMFEESTFLRK